MSDPMPIRDPRIDAFLTHNLGYSAHPCKVEAQMTVYTPGHP